MLNKSQICQILHYDNQADRKVDRKETSLVEFGLNMQL